MELKQRLQTHLTQIVRDRDPYLASGGHFFVLEYIRASFAQWASVEIHTFNVGSKTCKNLILNLPSVSTSQRNLPPILIGAHYDAVPGTPGADDNGTGVAVLLEFARTFAAKPMKYPLRLVAFDMEEYGLVGPSGCFRVCNFVTTTTATPALNDFFRDAGILRLYPWFTTLSSPSRTLLSKSWQLYCNTRQLTDNS